MAIRFFRLSAQNLGHAIPQRGKVQTESRARFTPLGEGLPQSGAAFTPPGYDHLDAKVFISLHTLQKSKLNPVCLIAYLAKMQTESGEGFATCAKDQTETRARFCNPCIIANRIADKVLHTLHFHALNQGKVLQTLQKSKPNFRHVSATPATVPTESGAYFCNLCNGLNHVRARF